MIKLLLPLTAISGVGAQIAKNFARLVNGNRVIDLLLHQPLRVEEINFCPKNFNIANNSLVIVKGKVEQHIQPEKSRQPHKFVCYSKEGYFSVVFFKIFPSQIAKLKIGNEIAILGKFQRLNGENQIIHPTEILAASEIAKMPKINVIYNLTYQVSQKILSAKINQVLAKINKSETETIDLNLVKTKGWSDFATSLKNLHFFNLGVQNKLIIAQELQRKARERLAFDELLAWQIASLMAKKLTKNSKENFVKENDLIADFLKNLSFTPTNAQKNAIAAISGEIFSSKKMLRLLQGDVGSGKTLVAICSCLAAISQKRQACVIAPTTVLAKQHFKYFGEFLAQFDLNIALLTSDSTKKQKREILENLANGKIEILIGTHALIEDNVLFENLGVAVIDEQHRFGVMQRLKLSEKNTNCDILLMSATPIPRSLMMGFYGNLDISILDEKPKNRQEIETLIISQDKQEQLFDGLSRALKKGEKIYWVCPAIDENLEGENLDLVAATKKFEELKNIFKDTNIGLLHGKMKEKEKEKIMQDFKDGEFKILVATTVIEVGVDVSDATIMVIENAQNFGLAQLHQLRGRVGRGDKKSFCFLIYSKRILQNGRKRLEVLRNSNDGFFIASQDLKMRGAGDLIGTRQSGLPEFKIADFDFDFDLLEIALKQAKIILNEDENLDLEKNKKYRDLLKLFGYDGCLILVTSG